MTGDTILVAGIGEPAGGLAIPAAAMSAERPNAPVVAGQVAQPLITLAAQPGGGSVTVRLHPADLGQVEIRLQRAPDGATRVTFRAERLDTLQALAGERAHIEAALDRAGVPAAQRSVTFEPQATAATRTAHLASTPSPLTGLPGTSHAHPSASTPSGGPSGVAADAAGQGWGSGGGSGQGQAGQRGGHGDWGRDRGGPLDPAEPTSSPLAAGRVLTGVDITA